MVASTEVGQIVLADHRGLHATLRSDTGRVEVDARVAHEELEVRVGVGDVDISLPTGAYDVDAVDVRMR